MIVDPAKAPDQAFCMVCKVLVPLIYSPSKDSEKAIEVARCDRCGAAVGIRAGAANTHKSGLNTKNI